jgi:hypothetical protein
MKATAYNVAALDKVLGLATQVGDSYKPGNTSIERTALAALLEESRKSVTAVLKGEGDLASAINNRQTAFDQLSLLGTQIISIAESGGMNEKDLQDLNRMRKNFRSHPFKSALNVTGEQIKTDVSAPSAETAVRKNRTLSYDSKVVTLEAIISYLEHHPAYNPTEQAFTIEGLKATLAELKAHNTEVMDAKSMLTKVRGKAKETIFDQKTGICGRARMVKKYLRTILGQRADLYRSISKVKFKTR